MLGDSAGGVVLLDPVRWNDSYSPKLAAATNGQGTKEGASDDRRAVLLSGPRRPVVRQDQRVWLDSVKTRRGDLDPKFLDKDDLSMGMSERAYDDARTNR